MDVVNAIVDAGRVWLLYRDPAGVLRKRAVPEDYSCWLARADGEKHERALRRQPDVRGLGWEGEWLRVRWSAADVRRHFCSDKGLAAHGISTFEGDVHPVDRAIIEGGHEVAKPRRVFLDIETDSRVPIVEKERARVLCWSLDDADGGEKAGMLEADSDAAEAALLRELWRQLEAYDQVVAWYGGGPARRYGEERGFDFPVIRARSRLLGVMPRDERRWLWLDHLEVYKRLHTATTGDEKSSMALHNVARAVLGKGKLDSLGGKTWHLWSSGERELLARYCAHDSALLHELEQKTGYLALLDALCRLSGIFPDTLALSPLARTDGLMLREAYARGLRLPTMLMGEEEAAFEGAYVMAPTERGIVKNVHVADFASMYPSIITSLNVSPETKVRDAPVSGPLPPGHARAPRTGVVFRTDSPGILPATVQKLLDLRAGWTKRKSELTPGSPEWHDADKMTTACKVAANSCYGVQANRAFRCHDRDVAEAISTTGAWVIKRVLALGAERGLRAIYSDTDSVMIVGCDRDRFAAFVDEVNGGLLAGELVPYGVRDFRMRLEFEKSFERIIFSVGNKGEVVKKRYVARYSHYKGKPATADSKPEVRGLEIRRSDTVLLARRMQQCVVDMLMRERVEVPEPFERLIGEWRARILEGELEREEFVLSKTLNKPLSEFAAKLKQDGAAAAQPPQVMLAHQLAERGKIPRRKPAARDASRLRWEVPRGVRIEFVVVDVEPLRVVWAEDYARTDTEGDEWLASHPEILAARADRHYLWERLVYPPTMRLLAGAFPGSDWSRYARTRPKKPRKGRAENQNQVRIELGPQSALRAIEVSPTNGRQLSLRGGSDPFIVRLRPGTEGKLEQVRDLFAAFPGHRPVELHVEMPDGLAVLSCPQRVAVTTGLLTRLRAIIGA